MKKQDFGDRGAHYRYEYRGIKLDPYRIAKIYKLSGPQEHLVKKGLRGIRKGQTYEELFADLRSIIDRWEEMIAEDYAESVEVGFKGWRHATLEESSDE